MPPSTSIIQQFLHPPVGVLTSLLDGNGPYSGIVTLTNWDDAGTPRSVTDSYGVLTQVTVIPPELGFSNGWVHLSDPVTGEEYEKRLVQIVVQHQLLLGGAFVTTQLLDSHMLSDMVLWEEAFPGRIGLYVLPGVSVDLYFLRAL